jgi:hypothetical protein
MDFLISQAFLILHWLVAVLLWVWIYSCLISTPIILLLKIESEVTNDHSSSTYLLWISTINFYIGFLLFILKIVIDNMRGIRVTAMKDIDKYIYFHIDYVQNIKRMRRIFSSQIPEGNQLQERIMHFLDDEKRSTNKVQYFRECY